jgi:glycosyltransferase involved in cell wall biosynthesis
MNILLLGEYNEGEVLTGPQKFLKRIAIELSFDHVVTVVAYFQDGAQYSLWEKLFGCAEIQRGERLQIWRLGIIPIVLRMLKGKYDVVHIASWGRFTVLSIALKPFMESTIVCTCHTILAFEYRSFRKALPCRFKKINTWIEKLLLRHSDIVIFVSSMLAQAAVKEGVFFKKSTIIYHGVDSSFFCKREYHTDSRPLSLVFIGDVRRQEKGFYSLVDSMRLCNRNITLFVISDTVAECNLSENIEMHFVQKMDGMQLSKFLQTKDVYLSVSEYDSFSIAASEAMAAGTVPIVSTTTGISELITHGYNGYIYKQGDNIELAKLITQLSQHRELLVELSAHAQKTMNTFSWRRVSLEYSRVYQTLTQKEL